MFSVEHNTLTHRGFIMKKVIFDILDSNNVVLVKGFTYTTSEDIQQWMETKFDWKQYNPKANSFAILQVETA
jgi:hypothetical protein